MDNSLFKKSLIASIWSSAAEVVAKVISPLVFLILTRILSPSDFGIVAIATTILGFTNIIVDVGTAKVLVQSQLQGKDFKELCDSAFWINTIFGFTIYLFCYLGSDFLANINNTPESSSVIKLMSIQVLFHSLSIVQTAIMRRELNFKVLFLIRLITVGTPALISIPIAFYGGGYWSIVIGSIIGSALSCSTLWIRSKWKPNIRNFATQIKQKSRLLFSKSIWTTIDQIIAFLPLALDTYLISNYLSPTDLGLYTSSRTLFSASISFALAPLMPVLFSSFSKLLADKVLFRKSVLIAQKLVFIVAASLGILVFGYREYITDILFNANWHGIENCIGIIFLVFGLEYFYSALLEGIRASGDFKGLAINTTISTGLTAIVLIITVHYGLIPYIIGRSLSLIIFYPGAFYLSKKNIKVSFIDCIINTRKELICIFAFILSVATIEYCIRDYLNKLIIISFISVIYILSIINSNRELITTLKTKLTKK